MIGVYVERDAMAGARHAHKPLVAETIVRFGYPALSKADVSDGIGGVPA